jgi:hypothetical protein
MLKVDIIHRYALRYPKATKGFKNFIECCNVVLFMNSINDEGI